jgi:ATP-dependent helicase HepA
VQCPAPRRLQLGRFLPLSPLRLLVDISGKSLGEVLPHDRLNGLCNPLPKQTAPAVIKQLTDEIGKLVQHANRLAEAALPERIDQAKQQLTETLSGELERLRALREVNPAIRADEIEAMEQRLSESRQALQEAAMQLQGLRLIVNA